MEQTPSVGRIVHYVSRGSADGHFPSVCRAAIITETPEMNRHGDFTHISGEVGLCVLNPTGMFFDQDVPYHDAGVLLEKGFLGGTWHWPERV